MLESIEIRLATPGHLSAMQEVVTVAYRELGYLPPNGDKVTYPDLNDLRHVALVAITKKTEEVIGTVLVTFAKNPDGIPVTPEFPEEIQLAWKDSHYGKLAYISRLAIKKEFRNKKTEYLLFRAISWVCLVGGAEAVLCIVNPRHENYYKKWGFKILAHKEKIEGIEKAPGTLLVFYQDYATLGTELERIADPNASRISTPMPPELEWIRKLWIREWDFEKPDPPPDSGFEWLFGNDHVTQ